MFLRFAAAVAPVNDDFAGAVAAGRSHLPHEYDVDATTEDDEPDPMDGETTAGIRSGTR